MSWEIWSEGYRVTGNSAGAQFHGTVDKCVAKTFKEACNIIFRGQEGNYDPMRLTLWGCELFDNEKDAKKGFG